jgi:methylenetetrahydrofolate dehydrogenase (NADP+)/methenyltetrahydrofolate cyclohydrolase
MLIDGKAIAHELKSSLKERIAKRDRRLKLGVIVVHETPEIRMFVDLKQRFATDIGVKVDIIRPGVLAQNTEHLLHVILQSTRTYDGLILQLPVPPQVDIGTIRRIFPLSHDVDVIGTTAYQQHKEHALPFLPPVTGAMAEILHREGVRLFGRKVLVVGEGWLVGGPAAPWAEHLGATVTIANRQTDNLAELTAAADTIILGAGSPGLLTPDMIREGVIILDAGTSEAAGVVRGDADPACAAKAKLFTPTPGGIGPITVAKVFENLLVLVALKEKRG